MNAPVTDAKYIMSDTLDVWVCRWCYVESSKGCACGADEPACDACKAPTAAECECADEPLELDSERPDYAPDTRGRW